MSSMSEVGSSIFTYSLRMRDDACRQFTAEEKEILRPIAEVIAMLDGNAFFTMDTDKGEWYEQYLPDAWSLYANNGGLDGWAGEASWVKLLRNQHPAVVEARRNLKVAVELSRD